jgi:hypothetical protein
MHHRADHRGPALTRVDEDAPYATWLVSSNDMYESSRLLLPGWLASFGGKVSGRPVAIGGRD